MTREDCADNAAAYVLGALEAGEAVNYGRHLATCAACRGEVAALQRVVDVLPVCAPQRRVPARLRRRVIGALRSGPR
jgi:anti-sigma factor RsiW